MSGKFSNIAIYKCKAESFYRFWIILGDIAYNFGEISNRLGCKDYFATHEATLLRTSSIGTPLPALMSRVASSSERSNDSSS